MAENVPLSDLGSQASFFTRLSQAVARWAGKPVTFAAACAVIVLWGASGPVFGFNDTWQLVINTSDHHHHVPDGVHHPEQPKPRYCGAAHKAG